jgi:hypothetical protein
MSHATSTTRPTRLRDIPLWRLLVALSDAERETGPSSPTTRLLARHIQERLRASRAEEEAGHAS